MTLIILIQNRDDIISSPSVHIIRDGKFTGGTSLGYDKSEARALQIAAEYKAQFPAAEVINKYNEPLTVADVLKIAGTTKPAPAAPMDPFDQSFTTQYALAKRIGDSRYGSECQHEKGPGGYCIKCLRSVR